MEHLVVQDTEIRLIHPHLALHGRRGQANFVAFDDPAFGHPPVDLCSLDVEASATVKSGNRSVSGAIGLRVW
ncbi:hypothetical protein L843_1726 [Mycobacterium intracellulare MIN_061107_1834]|nr:hypothetical protein L843_1726 [Mycobacterium intracellulare MIN_061107_1834]